MSNIENIRFFLGDLKASNYNLSFIQDVENLIKENRELNDKIIKLNNQILGVQSINDYFNKN